MCSPRDIILLLRSATAIAAKRYLYNQLTLYYHGIWSCEILPKYAYISIYIPWQRLKTSSSLLTQQTGILDQCPRGTTNSSLPNFMSKEVCEIFYCFPHSGVTTWSPFYKLSNRGTCSLSINCTVGICEFDQYSESNKGSHSAPIASQIPTESMNLLRPCHITRRP